VYWFLGLDGKFLLHVVLRLLLTFAIASYLGIVKRPQVVRRQALNAWRSTRHYSFWKITLFIRPYHISQLSETGSFQTQLAFGMESAGIGPLSIEDLVTFGDEKSLVMEYGVRKSGDAAKSKGRLENGAKGIWNARLVYKLSDLRRRVCNRFSSVRYPNLCLVLNFTV